MKTRDDLRTEAEAIEVMRASLTTPRYRKPEPKPFITFEVIAITIRCIIWLALGVALLWGVLE